MLNQLCPIFPEIGLTILAMVVLLGETFSARSRHWVHVSLVGLGITAFVLLKSAFCGAGCAAPTTVFGMIAVDPQAAFFKTIIVLSVMLVLWLSLDYREFKDRSMGTYSGLLLLATVGMMFLVGAVDLLAAVVSLELLSVCSFILTAFVYERRSSAEAAIKFLLVGAFSTGFFLFGISYYYGYFGTTSMAPILSSHMTGDSLLGLIMVFMIAGLGFKLAMVPFHMWAPDAYEGAPTPITAFLSVAPKAAAVGFLMRLFSQHAAMELTGLLAALAAITMTVGNVGALNQTNMKRLLAYSSIAQVGYILVALVAGGELGAQAAALYMFFYVFMNMGLFAGLILLSNKSFNDDVPTFAGLYQRSMPLAFMVSVFLLSLTGIPPLAGFVGKFAIFAAVMKTPSLLWLGIVAVLNSVISLYYYFRVLHQMFFREADDTSALSFSPALVCCLVISLGVTLVAGFLPNHVIIWVRNAVGS